MFNLGMLTEMVSKLKTSSELISYGCYVNQSYFIANYNVEFDKYDLEFVHEKLSVKAETMIKFLKIKGLVSDNQMEVIELLKHIDNCGELVKNFNGIFMTPEQLAKESNE